MRKILIICFLGVFLILLESCGRLNFDSYFNKTVEIEAKENNYSAYATGTIISNDGLIITNKHVVAGKNNILINYYDAPDIKYQAKILNVSKQYDLALIKLEESKDYFKKMMKDVAWDKKSIQLEMLKDMDYPWVRELLQVIIKILFIIRKKCYQFKLILRFMMVGVEIQYLIKRVIYWV